MDIDLSLIVPVYNAEKTLKRCIHSVLLNAPENIELIIIDDGSTDKSGEICKRYSFFDTRIRYYVKQNGGVSSARNMGIRLARGRYLCFVDSDDFITKNFYKVVLKNISADYDLIIIGRGIYDGFRISYSRENPCLIKKDPHLTYFLCRELKKQKLNLCCNKIYKKSVIDTYAISFPEQLDIGEDKVFVVAYASVCKSIKRISDILYITSLENRESLSRRLKDDLYQKAILEHQIMLMKVQSGNYSSWKLRKLTDVISYSYYRSAYTAINEINRYRYGKSETVQRKKDICKLYCMKKNALRLTKSSFLLGMPIYSKNIYLIDGIIRFMKIIK